MFGAINMNRLPRPALDARVLDANGRVREGMATGAWLAAAVCLLALPSAVLAFTADFTPPGVRGTTLAPLDQRSRDLGGTKLARAMSLRSLATSPAFPFTPAGTANRPDRSVTVAVRVGADAAKAIVVRGSTGARLATAEGDHLRIAPTAFNLGVSRGYRNFSQDLASAAPAAKPPADLTDVRKYSLKPGAADGASRFTPRVTVDDRSAGRAPRTFAGDAGEYDLGGAYRLTDRIDVTAGLRVSQERERIAPLTDGKQDNQAVYVGTQFRF